MHSFITPACSSFQCWSAATRPRPWSVVRVGVRSRTQCLHELPIDQLPTSKGLGAKHLARLWRAFFFRASKPWKSPSFALLLFVLAFKLFKFTDRDRVRFVITSRRSFLINKHSNRKGFPRGEVWSPRCKPLQDLKAFGSAAKICMSHLSSSNLFCVCEWFVEALCSLACAFSKQLYFCDCIFLHHIHTL